MTSLSTSSESPPAPLKRPRIRQACKRCREKKSKCTVHRPCPACLSSQEECIEWRPVARSSQYSSTAPVLAAEGPAHENDTSTGSLFPPLNGQASSSGLPQRYLPALPSQTIVSPEDLPADRIFRLPFPYEAVHKNEQGFLRSLSSSSGLGALQYFEEHRSLGQSVSQDSLSLLAELQPGTIDPSSWFTDNYFQPPEQTILPDDRPKAWSLVTQEIDEASIRSLVRFFMRTTYQIWPTFLSADFHATLENSERRESPEFVSLIVAIIGIAWSESCPVGQKDQNFIVKVIKLYTDIHSRWPHENWASVTSVQSLFYLALFCYGNSRTWGVNAAHGYIAEAVRRALDAGLHRSVDIYSERFTPDEIECRIRTLWALYCGDKLSAAYGRPVLLRSDGEKMLVPSAKSTDISVDEIDVKTVDYSERLDPSDMSMRPYILAHTRLCMVLERILNKINLPSCTKSKAIQELSTGPRRLRVAVSHQAESCSANHSAQNFDSELQLIDKYRFLDLPVVTNELEDDNVYHRHSERLRTMAAFSKMFAYRHLFVVSNNDIVENRVDLTHAGPLHQWTRELLASQRKMLDRGQFTDTASTCSYQISQAGRSLLALLYITKLGEQHDGHKELIYPRVIPTFQLAIRLLRILSLRFGASNRSLDILLASAERLGIDLDVEDNDGDAYAMLASNVLDPGQKDWIKNLPLSNPFVLALGEFNAA